MHVSTCAFFVVIVPRCKRNNKGEIVEPIKNCLEEIVSMGQSHNKMQNSPAKLFARKQLSFIFFHSKVTVHPLGSLGTETKLFRVCNTLQNPQAYE